MSTKMLKRSLALGALMAFVITGNALAAGVSNQTMTVTDTRTGNVTLFDQTTSEEIICEGDNLIIDNGASINTPNYNYVSSVYLDRSKPKGTATNNTLKINEGANVKSGYIYGAYVKASGIGSAASQTRSYAIANKNKIIITSDVELIGLTELSVSSAGYASAVEAIANENIVEISGENTEVKGVLFAAYSGGYGNSGADSGNAKAIANDNYVEIVDATVDCIGGAYIHTQTKTNQNLESSIEAKNNTVKIMGKATVETQEGIYGVYVANGINGSPGKYDAVVENNTIIIEGEANIKASKGIYGAFVQGKGANENNVVVRNNSVTIGGNAKIDEGTVIYGGYAESLAKTDYIETEIDTTNSKFTETDYDYGGTANKLTAIATGNTVNITGDAVVKGEVYGGYASAFEGGNDIETNASGNIINVSGNADISGATLIGSATETLGEKKEVSETTVDMTNPSSPTSTTVTNRQDAEDTPTSAQNTSNNALNISKDWTGGENGNKEVKTLGNFDEIVIEEMQYGETALTVTEKIEYKADEDGNPNSNGTKITVKRMNMAGDQELAGELEIIKATKSNLDDANNKGAISDESTVKIYKGTSEIIDVGFGGEAGMELKEENIKRTTRNDQVLVIGESRAAATAFVNQGSELVETGLDALARDNAKAGDTKAFAAVYGNASEYATGSHVKVNGWSGIVGVGKTNANGLTVGAFFENGTGNYRTYNTVNNDFMRGDGDATYNGGGLLVRKDNTNGVYTEASLRAGNLQNELRNAVRGSEGLAGYDVDTFYYGAHVGVGKIIPRGNEGDSIDVYGKFIYTHHDSEDFNIDGSDFHFDSVDSERLRLGFRINEVQTNKLSMYYGAAWEYEFGGDADNTTVGYDLSTPSLGGSTVIGEIGMHYNANEKWSLDLNVRGYSGQRDGFTGSVQANYAF